MRPKRRFGSVLAALLAIVFVYIGACWWLSGLYLAPSKRTALRPTGSLDLLLPTAEGKVPLWASPGIGASLASREGVRARGSGAGREIDRSAIRAVYILIHGHGGHRGSWTEAYRGLVDAGFEVLVPEMPGHGVNPDPVCGFGPKESRIAVALARAAREASGEGVRIVGVGLSLGGAALWLAGRDDPEAFDAIVSEGSFAELQPTVDRWFSRAVPGMHVAMRPVQWFAQMRTGVHPSQVRPVEAARAWRGRPALVIHAAEDRLAPEDDARRLAEAAQAELWVVPGAGHAHAWGADPQGYLTRLASLAE
ncbi:MAG: alpha/beta fold hydrolase [Fimbriimonadaceae bacterium]